MTDKKTSRILADYAMKVHNNLNRSLDPMNMEMWDRVMEARENNEKNAQSQKDQASFYRLGAIGSLGLSILAGGLSLPGGKLCETAASFCNAATQQVPNAVQIFSKSADADITHFSQETRINEFAQQRFSQMTADLNKMMTELTDAFTKYISKQVLN